MSRTWSGFALSLWALHLLVRDFTFAFTHGTTEGAMGLTFLGVTSKQYAIAWTAFGPLALVGAAGLYSAISQRLGKLGKAGFAVTFLGLTSSFVAAVMQYWILDIDLYFYSPLIYGGWLLSLASVVVLSAGLILAGVDIARADALPGGRFLILVAGLILVPTGLFVGYIVGHSNNSLPWQLVYGAVSVPYDLCWLRVGLTLLADRTDRRRGESQPNSVSPR